jgi:ligand-binding sensor domain-containing protein/signal transduction histidine kinase
MKMPIRISGAGVLLAFVSLQLVAQNYSGTMRFDHIDHKDGLSNNSVTSILMDQQGFIWIGTYGGLNRYDGYKIRQYRTEPDQPNSIPSNTIRALYEDEKGIIWIGTHFHGLVIFDPSTEVFTKHRPSNADEIPAVSQVRRIYKDNDNQLWLASDQGLIFFDTQSNRFIQHTLPNSASITTIRQSSNGHLWVGTTEGIFIFDKKTRLFSRFSPDGSDAFSAGVYALYEDENNMLWIGSIGDGLFKYNKLTQRLTAYRSDPRVISSISNNVIHDIQQIEPNKLWIATELGLNILDIRSGKFTRLVHNPDNPTSVSENVIWLIYKDKGEAIWLGTGATGVNKTHKLKKKFNHYLHDPLNPNSLSSNNVFAIQEDHLGKLWIGTIDGGLDRFDPVTKRFKHFKPNARDPKSISSSKILSLHIGPSKNLWIGTDLDGLCMLPAQHLKDSGNHFLRYSRGLEPKFISYNIIYSVFEDRNAVVWAGTWSKGLNKLVFAGGREQTDYKSPLITHYEYDPRDTTGVSHDVIFTLFEDRQGTLWIGTAGGGLNKKVSAKSGTTTDKFVHYGTDPGDPSSLSDDFVSCIYESRKGEFWIGTTTGLNKMNREEGTFKAYTTRHGLGNNVVFGILEDSHGNLWLSTHGGISKFDPIRETFRNYTIEDGIQGNVFNPDAYYLSRTGEMYFGGTNGITSFFPDSIYDSPVRPQVMITNFWLINQAGKKIRQDEARQRSLIKNRTITLSHNDQIFSFEFSASSYSVPSKNNFAYKLEGFNNDWIYTDANNRIATFTNLDPGNYKFIVKASNADGIWNEQGISIAIAIKPPYWQTQWFQAMAVVGFLGLVWSIYYWRISAIKLQKKVLERIVMERTNEILQQKEEIETQKESIQQKNLMLENQQLHLEKLVEERTLELTKMNQELKEKNQRFEEYGFMTSHNFRGPVATLIGLCNIFNKENLADDENLILVEKIRETTLKIDDMIKDLNKLLDHETRIQTLTSNVDLEEVIKSTMAILDNEIKASGATVTYHLASARFVRGIPAYITSIFYNLISNAIKFRKENEPLHVEVHGHKNTDSIIIKVQDNGIGIDLTKHGNNIFQPFKRFFTHVPGKGLGLYLVKSQMRAMGGDIRVESEEGKGTIFTLALQNHES